MALLNADRRPPGKRRRIWLRLTVWTIALLWLAHYAYVRITTPPAAVATQQRQSAGADFRRDELSELITELPNPPTPMQMPASGLPITSTDQVLADSVLGDWAPDPNSAQDLARKYVSKPTTSQTLDEIVAFCNRLEESPDQYCELTQLPADPSAALISYARYQDAIAALTFRARCRVAEKSDVAGALADLRAAARLATIQQQSRMWSVGWAGLQGYSLVQYELGCLAREVDLQPDLAREMIAYLSDKLSLSVADVVTARVRAGMQVDDVLDRYYTDDGAGNGWLVLSAASEQLTLFYAMPATERSRAWNVFSPLFSDRRTMRAKLLGLTDDLRQLDQMSYEEAQRFLENRSESARAGSVLDGPLFQLAQGIDEYTFDRLFDRVMRRRALVVMLGLSAYKHTHGEYPETLDALAPGSLSEVPLDALTSQAFRYEKLAGGDYDLRPGTAEQQSASILYLWWESTEAYRPNSYVPQRTPRPD